MLPSNISKLIKLSFVPWNEFLNVTWGDVLKVLRKRMHVADSPAGHWNSGLDGWWPYSFLRSCSAASQMTSNDEWRVNELFDDWLKDGLLMSETLSFLICPKNGGDISCTLNIQKFLIDDENNCQSSTKYSEKITTRYLYINHFWLIMN